VNTDSELKMGRAEHEKPPMEASRKQPGGLPKPCSTGFECTGHAVTQDSGQKQLRRFAYEDYCDSLVVFADILGMSREVSAIQDEAGFQVVSAVIQLLQGQAKLWSSLDGMLDKLKAFAISDSLVISMPWQSSVAATALITAMHSFQYEMLLRAGHLLRGFMTRGKLFHVDQFLFGEGFVRAYNAEIGLKGGPPRIVLDPQLIEFALARGADSPPVGVSSAFNMLRRDPRDGKWFIDYLKPVGVLEKESPDELRVERKQVRQWVRERAVTYQDEQSIAEKYTWLAEHERSTRAEFLSLLQNREKGPIG
jgi:hypothetical protein